MNTYAKLVQSSFNKRKKSFHWQNEIDFFHQRQMKKILCKIMKFIQSCNKLEEQGLVKQQNEDDTQETFRKNSLLH